MTIIGISCVKNLNLMDPPHLIAYFWPCLNGTVICQFDSKCFVYMNFSTYSLSTIQWHARTLSWKSTLNSVPVCEIIDAAITGWGKIHWIFFFEIQFTTTWRLLEICQLIRRYLHFLYFSYNLLPHISLGKKYCLHISKIVELFSHFLCNFKCA